MLGSRTLVMGVVNVTPDSFSDGGLFETPEAAVRHALKLVEDGADLLDVGGESSRPGAEPVVATTELARVLPVVRGIREESEIPISVDTYKASVARAVLQEGADIINDISAFRFDADLPRVVCESGAGVVLMHMRGTPGTMQLLPPSADILSEIYKDLGEAVDRAAEAGVPGDRILLDPGIGFGKTVKDNLKILNQLPSLHRLGFPLLLGTSRKSFLGKILETEVSQLLFGTAASVAASVIRGAHIVRVHDVPEMRQVIRVADAIVEEAVQWRI